MALSKLKTTLLSVFMVFLAFANMEVALCHLVKGSVSCVDCGSHYDYSGIRVLINCDNRHHLHSKTGPAVALTKKDGSFQSHLRHLSPGSVCHARLLGGPKQLYASSKRNMVHAKLVADKYSNTFTTAAPLTFATSCSSLTTKHGSDCSARNQRFGSSKTVDLPIPPEYGFAPTSYYFSPYMPIIGIP